MQLSTIIIGIVLVILAGLVVAGVIYALNEGDQNEEKNKNNHNDSTNN